MANTNAPFGFRPVGRVAGQMPNGSMTKYRLASGTAANIFIGDPVQFLSTGYITKASVSAQIRGVVAGIKWIDTNGKDATSSYWASGTTTLNGADADIYVYDDPFEIFEVQYGFNDGSAPALGDLGQTFNAILGTLAGTVTTIGNTAASTSPGNFATGISTAAIDTSTRVGTATVWRLLDWSSKPDNDTTSAYAKALVTPNLHDFRVNAGV